MGSGAEELTLHLLAGCRKCKRERPHLVGCKNCATLVVVNLAAGDAARCTSCCERVEVYVQ